MEWEIPRHRAAFLERRCRASYRISPTVSPDRAIFTRIDGRKPYASINFVTAHDGFTLCDLVSYNQKHNEANQDDNKDGTDNNDSWNMGVEGPTDDHGHQ